MNTREEITADLEDLGADAQDIANKLRALGVKGKRDEGSSCPIFNYLHFKGHDKVSFVQSRQIKWEDDTKSIYSGCNTPQPVASFILMFDDGYYYYLEDK